jgi:hypothetical protein
LFLGVAGIVLGIGYLLSLLKEPSGASAKVGKLALTILVFMVSGGLLAKRLFPALRQPQEGEPEYRFPARWKNGLLIGCGTSLALLVCFSLWANIKRTAREALYRNSAEISEVAPPAPFQKKAQRLGPRVTLAVEKCSAELPAGWEQRKSGRGKPMFLPPADSGYSTNLLFSNEAFPKPMDEYASKLISDVEAISPLVRMSARTTLMTNSGVVATRLTFNNQMEAQEITQVFYLFEAGPGRKISVCGSVLTSQAGDIVPLYDACMKTFALAPTEPK